MRKFLLFVASLLFFPIVAAAQTSQIPQQCKDSSGSGTVQSCTTVLTLGPVSGDLIIYTTTTANTGDVTLSVDGKAAAHIRKWSGSSTLASGDLPANNPVSLIFDGTYWEIQTIGNPPASGGSGTVTTFSSGNLSPLFTTNVATATSTPALTYAISSAPQNSVLAGPATGGAGPYSFQLAPTFSAANLNSFPTLNQNTTGNAATATNATEWGGITLGTAPVGAGYCPTSTSVSAATWQLCGTGANTALSNLASVAVNLALTPGTDNSISLDSLTKRYINGWFSGVVGWTNGSGTADTGLSRDAAGVVDVGNGTAGDKSGTLQSTVLETVAGANPGLVLIPGQTGVPSIPANSTGFLGPNSATLTSYVLQFPTTGPTTALPFLSCPTPSANISACSFVAGTGTVTSFSSGNLSPLFTTSVATSTSTPALSFSLSNAAAGTVFGNATSSSGAPAYTATPQLGASGVIGSLTMGNATSGLLTLQPATGALGTVTVSIPAATDTLVNLAGTQTLTNKSLALTEINSGLTSGGVVCATSTTVISMTAALTANVLPKGGGAGVCPTNSSITDNGTTVSTAEPIAVGASSPTCAGTPAGPGCFTEGTAATAVAGVDDIHADSTQKGFEINNNNTGEMMISRSTCINVTPVTVSANVTSDQGLMNCTLSANLLNVVGRTLHVHAAGIYSTAATSTAQLTFKAKLCTVSGCGSGTVINLINIQTVAIGSLTIANNNWSLDFYATTQTAGATAAFESHGQLTIDLGSLTTTADSIYADTNTATISSIDTTAGLFLQITGAYSSGSTSNSMSQRQGIEEVLN